MKDSKPASKKVIISVAIAFSALFFSDCGQYRLRMLLKSKKLEGVNLSGFDFYNLDLRDINLTRARLVHCGFSFTNLTNAKFINADLRSADLSGANLTGADLRGANLRYAVLKNAVLRNANLVDAYFYDANLNDTDLRGAVLVGEADGSTDAADILKKIDSGAITYFVHLRNADMKGAAIGIAWKPFIERQNVRNFDKILFLK